MATHDYPATSSSGPDISGTPSAGNYARWSDADTLEARTTAQVLSDIGAPNISGTPVAGQMAVWSDADTLQGVRRYYGQLSHGTYTNGTLITLPFLASGGAADGEYCVRVTRRATGANTTSVNVIGFLIASNAVSGTPVCADGGPSRMTARVAVSGGAVCVHLAIAPAAILEVEVFTSVSVAGGAFAVSDVAATGTATTNQNAVASLTMAGALSGATTIDCSSLATLGSARLGASGALTHSTSDGSDNGYVGVAGGGALGTTRGASVTCYGNEHASTGEVIIEAGNVSGGDIDLKTQALSRIKVNYDGTLTFHATTLADLQSQLGGAASVASAYLSSDNNMSSGFTFNSWNTLTGWTSRLDTDSFYTTDDWTIPAGKAGLYLVTFTCTFTPGTAGYGLRTQVYVNGAAVTGAPISPSSSNSTSVAETITWTAILDLEVGDVLTAKVRSDNANDPGTIGGGDTTAGRTTFELAYLGA